MDANNLTAIAYQQLLIFIHHMITKILDLSNLK